MKQKVVHLARLAILGCLMFLLGAGAAWAQRGITVTGRIVLRVMRVTCSPVCCASVRAAHSELPVPEK